MVARILHSSRARTTTPMSVQYCVILHSTGIGKYINWIIKPNITDQALIRGSGSPACVYMKTAPHNLHTCISECPEEVPLFEGSPGLTIDGKVVPPIKGVSITIELEDGERLETTTDSMGKYK